MSRVYHNGAAGIAPPMAGPDPEARAVLGSAIDLLCFDPVDAGMHVKIIIMLAMEGL